MGPTPTRTLGMRLSCNFVNVYTIVYHVQYTYTCTRAHPQRTSSRGKARVGQKSADFVGELNGPRALRQADCRGAARANFRERRTRRLSREDSRTEVGEEVGVGVSPVEFKLKATMSSLGPICHVSSRSGCGWLQTAIVFTFIFTLPSVLLHCFFCAFNLKFSRSCLRVVLLIMVAIAGVAIGLCFVVVGIGCCYLTRYFVIFLL